MFPQTQRVRLVSLCVGVTEPLPFLPLRASYGNKGESAQTDGLAQATIQEVLHRSRCFAHRSSRARGLIRGWIQTAWRMDALPKKSHQRSQSTGCVLVRKAPTTPHSQATAPQAKDRGGLQGSPRWGFKRHPRQGVNVKSTWPGCEVKQVGDLSLFAIPLPHFSHSHPWIVIADDRCILCGGDPPPRSVRRNHFSRPMGTAMERKPTPALQALAP